MKKSKKVFGVGLGLAILMMVGTITAYAEESTPIAQQEIVSTEQSNGDVLSELLDDLEAQGIPAENIAVNGNKVTVLKDAPSSPLTRGLVSSPVIVELWDCTNSRLWIGDLMVLFNGVYDGQYVTIADVFAAPSIFSQNPIRTELQIDNYGANNYQTYSQVWIEYNYLADDGERYGDICTLNVDCNGIVTVIPIE